MRRFLRCSLQVGLEKHMLFTCGRNCAHDLSKIKSELESRGCKNICPPANKSDAFQERKTGCAARTAPICERREQAKTRVISSGDPHVAYCCSVKLYTLAVWVHLSQQYQRNNLYLRFLSRLAKRHNDFHMQHSTRMMSDTLCSFHLLAFAEDCSCVPSVFLRDFHTRKLQRVLQFAHLSSRHKTTR